MRPIYVPIADSFFESSIMQESVTVRFVMLALIRLALRAGAEGVVDIDLRTFAGAINLQVDEVEKAIERLMEPDPASASLDEDGRRLVPVNPGRPQRGWRLVNWTKYRHLVAKANDAARKRDSYHGKKDKPDVSESLQHSPKVSKTLREAPKTSVRSTKYEERRTSIKTPPTPSTPKDLLRVWNENRGVMLPARDLTGTRPSHAKTRLREEPDLERWTAAIQRAARSKFCLGGGERGWKANFDWLLRPGTLAKIEEGQFDEVERYPSRAEVSDFFKIHVGLERDLLGKRFREYFGVEYRPSGPVEADGAANLPAQERPTGEPGPNEGEDGPEGGET